MATEKRERTVSYRRAEWLIENTTSINLEKCIREACLKLKTSDERTIRRGDDQLVSLAHLEDEKPKGIFVHIVADTPGESASIVPIPKPDEQALEVTTMAPPEEFELLDADAFLYLVGNDVCICSVNLRTGALAYTLKELFKKAKIRNDATKFELMKVADVSKVAFIKSHGIKEIELRASLYQASASYTRRKSQPFSMLGAATRQFKALLGKDNDVTNDSLRAILTIKLDRRMTGGLKLGEKEIQTLATELVKNQEHEDDFVIVTKDGQKITPNEIYITSKVSVEKKGKTVDRDKAWEELRKFYRNLKSSGALEI